MVLRVPAYLRARQVEQQVELARSVQQTLLPSGQLVSGRIELAGECVPAWEVGGDFYDSFSVDQQRVALVLVDVSGKGLPAALLASLIHGAVHLGNWTESPAQHGRATQQLNRLLFERASGERYATMFWCYYDYARQALHYINAGHCPPLLVRRRDGEMEVLRLSVGGPVVGLLPAAHFEQASVPISPGDVLVVFSDRVVEATDERDEEFGEQRLAELLQQHCAASADEIRKHILSALESFIGKVRPQDDLTFVVVRFECAAAMEPEFLPEAELSVPA